MRVVVVDRGVPTALAGGGRRPAIRVDRALLDRLDDDELDGVLAHELAHVAAREGTIVRLAAGAALLAAWLVRLAAEDRGWLLLVGATAALGLGLVALRAATRSAELAADRVAAVLTGDPAALARALHSLDAADLTLAATPPPLANPATAWLAVGRTASGEASPLLPDHAGAPVVAGRSRAAPRPAADGTWRGAIAGLLATHPTTDERVAALARQGTSIIRTPGTAEDVQAASTSASGIAQTSIA